MWLLLALVVDSRGESLILSSGVFFARARVRIPAFTTFAQNVRNTRVITLRITTFFTFEARGKTRITRIPPLPLITRARNTSSGNRLLPKMAKSDKTA